jgi:hypothetical protein
MSEYHLQDINFRPLGISRFSPYAALGFRPHRHYCLAAQGKSCDCRTQFFLTIIVVLLQISRSLSLKKTPEDSTYTNRRLFEIADGQKFIEGMERFKPLCQSLFPSPCESLKSLYYDGWSLIESF